MARRDRMAAAGAVIGGRGGALALDPDDDPLPPTGPHDGDDLDAEVTDAIGLVDFGAVRVPIPARGTVTVDAAAKGRMQAVHVAMPEGRLSVSALAAPKSSKLWPDLAKEIDASLRDGGAIVRSFTGDWGRELHATSGGAKSVFIGVDGPRWMLYGVATGPVQHAEALDADLRRMLRGTIVVRGKSPYPVRTILPLVMPDHLAAEVEGAAEQVADEAPAQQPGVQRAGVEQPSGRQAIAQRPARVARPQRVTPEAPAARRVPALPEDAPSARRAAAAAWRTRPAAPRDIAETGEFPATEALPLVGATPPQAEPPVRARTPEPASPLAEALRRAAVNGTGGRRRLREFDEEDGGRRRLREPGPVHPGPTRDGDDARMGGRRRLREDFPGQAAHFHQAPAEPERLRRHRYLDEPDSVGPRGRDGSVEAGDSAASGRRYLPEPEPASASGGVPTQPWPIHPAGRQAEPGGSGRALASSGWRRELGDTGDERPGGWGARPTPGADRVLDETGRSAERGAGAARRPHPDDAPTERLVRPVLGAENGRPSRRGRHSAPEPGESTPATIPIRLLLGDLPSTRSTGRHHRVD